MLRISIFERGISRCAPVYLMSFKTMRKNNYITEKSGLITKKKNKGGSRNSLSRDVDYYW